MGQLGKPDKMDKKDMFGEVDKKGKMGMTGRTDVVDNTDKLGVVDTMVEAEKWSNLELK